MEPIVIVENVSKKFSRKADAHLDYSLRDLLSEICGRKKNILLRQDEFWAVRDVSFALYPGDSLALIGCNGAGKTTMLNMLNGTLKPDTGKIIVNGRVQALINLGTGFHPNLSGRENIYNAAAVLGLNRKETRNIVAEVIDFAELEDAIDSPVQSYSSGMKARLGFSIVVHLRPDILLIDEVLAVGDYAFKNKCFARMQQLKREGVTIILVSHVHTRVIQVCEQALWLHHANVVKRGQAKEVVKAYLAFLDKQEIQKIQTQQNPTKKKNNQTNQDQKPTPTLYGSFISDSFEHIENLNVSLLVNGHKVDAFKIHEKLIIEYEFQLKRAVKKLGVNLVFYRENDGLHYSKISTLNGNKVNHIQFGRVSCRVTIPDFNLNPGSYVLLMAIFEGHSVLYRNVVKEFVVMSNGNLTWGLIDFTCSYEVL